MLRAQQDASMSKKMPRTHQNITGCTPIFQVALKMPGGHQMKGWLPIKMTVGHHKAICPTNQMLGAHRDANIGVLKNTCWVSTKMPGGHQNTMWPTKEVPGAQQDAACPPKGTPAGHQDAR